MIASSFSFLTPPSLLVRAAARPIAILRSFIGVRGKGGRGGGVRDPEVASVWRTSRWWTQQRRQGVEAARVLLEWGGGRTLVGSGWPSSTSHHDPVAEMVLDNRVADLEVEEGDSCCHPSLLPCWLGLGGRGA